MKDERKTYLTPAAELFNCDVNDVISTSVGVSSLWDLSGNSVNWDQL